MFMLPLPYLFCHQNGGQRASEALQWRAVKEINSLALQLFKMYLHFEFGSPQFCISCKLELVSDIEHLYWLEYLFSSANFVCLFFTLDNYLGFVKCKNTCYLFGRFVTFAFKPEEAFNVCVSEIFIWKVAGQDDQHVTRMTQEFLTEHLRGKEFFESDCLVMYFCERPLSFNTTPVLIFSRRPLVQRKIENPPKQSCQQVSRLIWSLCKMMCSCVSLS